MLKFSDEGNEFLGRLYKTGIATDEELFKFAIEDLFIMGNTLVDFEDYLLELENGGFYSRELIKWFLDAVIKQSKKIKYEK